MLRKLLVFIFFSIVFSGFSQSNYLDKLVNLKVNNTSYENVFKLISAQTGVVFSYGGFNNQQKITYTCSKKALKLVLTEILEGKCSYKIKDKYIVLNCSGPTKESQAKITKISLSGFIKDIETNQAIIQASIYSKDTKNSCLSDSAGKFKLIVQNKGEGQILNISKENYRDTSIWFDFKEGNGLVIYLRPIIDLSVKPEIHIFHDSVAVKDTTINKVSVLKDLNHLSKEIKEEGQKVWRRIKTKNSNYRNIRDTLFSRYSFSFVPPISTNKFLSINTVNQYSLNVLVGYSKGVERFEIGGLANIDAGNVSFLQIAGVTNIVKGDLLGVQIAGIANVNSKKTNGVQIGGVANVNRGNIVGTQIGGITNVNFSSFDGIQVAGITNLNKKGFNGTQIAGISNLTINQTKGIQIAGIVNSADTIEGIQIAGICNYAHKVEGVQIGLINISKSIDGIPIGFFSYVKNGYHKIEMAHDDLNLTSIGFRTGVEKLHNVFYVGKSFINPVNVATFAYGLGSAFKLNPKWYFNMEVSSQALIFEGQKWDNAASLSKFITGIEFRPVKKFALFVGPTYNVFVSKNSSPNMQSFVQSNPFYEKKFANNTLKMWIGAKFSIKFL